MRDITRAASTALVIAGATKDNPRRVVEQLAKQVDAKLDA